MGRQLMKHTQVCITLSVNVQVRRGHDTRLVTLPLLPLTTLFFWLWAIRETVFRIGFELASIADDLYQALTFTGKVAAITFNALAFGLGVTL